MLHVTAVLIPMKFILIHCGRPHSFNISPHHKDGYYWENEAQWQKIVDGLKTNKIAIATVNLTNTKSVYALSDYIETTTFNFGLFDASNIPVVDPKLKKADVLLYSESVACRYINYWKRQ